MKTMDTTVDVLMPVWITQPEWQLPMTLCAIDTMQACTTLPFRFVVVERGHALPSEYLPEGSIHITESNDGVIASLNEGLAACTAEFVVHTGNDVFVRPRWLGAMLEPFTVIPDCGITTLASSDLPAPMGTVGDNTVEGVYGPHMMFRRTWRTSSPTTVPKANEMEGGAVRFDPKLRDIFGDTDLVMAHYAAGLRSYRNRRVQIAHLNKATFNHAYSQEDQQALFKAGSDYFAQKYAAFAHLRMFHYLAGGLIV
jgi:hypothetical protein